MKKEGVMRSIRICRAPWWYEYANDFVRTLVESGIAAFSQ